MVGDLSTTGRTAGAMAAVKEISKPRLFYMDNLKILLIVLVVIHHAAQPYGPGGAWIIDPEPEQTINVLLLGLFFAVNSAFFMGLFFLISAYFVQGSYDRKGPAQFMEDRLVRLGTPIPIIVMGVTPVMYYLLKVKDLPFFDFYIQNLDDLSLGYLWFPAMLLVFAAGYIAWRTAFKTPKLTRAEGFPGAAKVLAFVAAMALLSFAIRIVSPVNEWSWFHILEPAHLPQYVMLFAAGIVAYRRGWLDRIPAATAKAWTIVAALMAVAAPVIFFTLGDSGFHGGLSAMALLWSAWEALMCVSMCIALLALFKNRFGGQGRIAKALADNTYAVYLVHLPVVVFLQYLLVGVDIHPLLKFLAVVIAAVPACFALGEAIRKLPYAKYVL